MKIVKFSLGRWLLNRADERIRISREHGLHALPHRFFFRRAAEKLLGLNQADVSIDSFEAALKALREFAAESAGVLCPVNDSINDRKEN
jgi:hypothetical protein